MRLKSSATTKACNADIANLRARQLNRACSLSTQKAQKISLAKPTPPKARATSRHSAAGSFFGKFRLKTVSKVERLALIPKTNENPLNP
jgi:hypothetical protein